MNASTGRYPFFPRFRGVISLTDALLVSVDGLNGRIDTDMDALIPQSALLPEPFPEQVRNAQQSVRLIDAQAVHITPKGGGCRQYG